MRESLLKWMGGKHALAPWIMTKFPPHKRYVDVFAGGLHMTSNKENAEENIVNDINGNLIDVYKCIHGKSSCAELTAMLEEMCVYSEKLFLDYKKIIEDTENFKKLRLPLRAFIYIYLNRTSFNGKGKDFARRADGSVLYGMPPILKKLHRKFQAGSYVFTQEHWANTLQRYDSEDTLFYLDPPYYVTATSKGKDYYEYVMDVQAHANLAMDIDKYIKLGNWILSYDDVPQVRKLYKSKHIILSPSKCQTSGNAIAGQKEQETVYKQELLISNLPIENINTIFDEC